ncbi:hypothetical protein [Paenibacillus sp. KN14-4R]|uniref:hypothetical protein n=1 Tax=Paenibacillus sp. KN14-4R TaxID=3445773 RepID=UPI003FA09116
MAQQIRLSQNTAILLEHARKFISDEVLLTSVATGDVSELAAAETDHYSYEDFVTYAADHNEDLDLAIRNGYRMTFNTFRGLQVWLRAKFGIQEGTDFKASEGHLSGFKLSVEDAQLLEARLAPNWVMNRNEIEGTLDLVVRGLNSTN